MAVEMGTAAGYLNLLDRLRLFLTTNADLVAAGQEWQQLSWRERPDAAGEWELIVKGTGLAGEDEIFAGIRTYSSVGADYYNWELGPALGYDPGLGWAAQPGLILAERPKVYLWQHAIDYWFVANGRRFMVVAKVSTVFELAHLGLILPYAPPAALPLPYLVAGSGLTAAARWSDTSTNHAHGLLRPYISGSRSVTRIFTGEEWRNLATAANTSGLWPYIDGATTVFANLRANHDGTRTLFPILPMLVTPAPMIYGEIDGAFWVAGHGSAAGNLIHIDDVDHLVVQNVHRTTADSYWALRLE